MDEKTLQDLRKSMRITKWLRRSFRVVVEVNGELYAATTRNIKAVERLICYQLFRAEQVFDGYDELKARKELYDEVLSFNCINSNGEKI